MQPTHVIAGLLLATGWAGMLLSVAFYLLFWRVDREPGAVDLPGLWWAAISCSTAGGFTFVVANVYLLIKQAWIWLRLAWLLCLLILLAAFLLSPLLLILLV